MPFDKFWELVEWKTGKGNAEKAYKTKTEWPGDKEAAEVYNAYVLRTGKYAKHPGTWIRAKGWLDTDRPEAPVFNPNIAHEEYKPKPYEPNRESYIEHHTDITRKWYARMGQLYGHESSRPVILVGFGHELQRGPEYHPLNGWMVYLFMRFSRRLARYAWCQTAYEEGRCSKPDLEKARRDCLPTLQDVDSCKAIAAKYDKGKAPESTLYEIKIRNDLPSLGEQRANARRDSEEAGRSST